MAASEAQCGLFSLIFVRASHAWTCDDHSVGSKRGHGFGRKPPLRLHTPHSHLVYYVFDKGVHLVVVVKSRF